MEGIYIDYCFFIVKILIGILAPVKINAAALCEQQGKNNNLDLGGMPLTGRMSIW